MFPPHLFLKINPNNLQITYYIAPKIDDEEDENEQDSDEDNLLNNIEEENEIME